MTVSIILIVLAVWLLFSGWRFYRQVNWEEPVGVTVDLAELRKKEAELQHIEDVLLEAQSQGKLNEACVKEFQRFSAEEMRTIHLATQSIKR